MFWFEITMIFLITYIVLFFRRNDSLNSRWQWWWFHPEHELYEWVPCQFQTTGILLIPTSVYWVNECATSFFGFSSIFPFSNVYWATHEVLRAERGSGWFFCFRSLVSGPCCNLNEIQFVPCPPLQLHPPPFSCSSCSSHLGLRFSHRPSFLRAFPLGAPYAHPPSIKLHPTPWENTLPHLTPHQPSGWRLNIFFWFDLIICI